MSVDKLLKKQRLDILASTAKHALSLSNDEIQKADPQFEEEQRQLLGLYEKLILYWDTLNTMRTRTYII